MDSTAKKTATQVKYNYARQFDDFMKRLPVIYLRDYLQTDELTGRIIHKPSIQEAVEQAMGFCEQEETSSVVFFCISRQEPRVGFILGRAWVPLFAVVCLIQSLECNLGWQRQVEQILSAPGRRPEWRYLFSWTRYVKPKNVNFILLGDSYQFYPDTDMCYSTVWPKPIASSSEEFTLRINLGLTNIDPSLCELAERYGILIINKRGEYSTSNSDSLWQTCRGQLINPVRARQLDDCDGKLMNCLTTGVISALLTYNPKSLVEYHRKTHSKELKVKKKVIKQDSAIRKTKKITSFFEQQECETDTDPFVSEQQQHLEPKKRKITVLNIIHGKKEKTKLQDPHDTWNLFLQDVKSRYEKTENSIKRGRPIPFEHNIKSVEIDRISLVTFTEKQ